MSLSGELLADGDVEPRCYKDFIGIDYHGKVMSHIDAFSHIAYKGQLYGGVNADDAFHAEGMAAGDVTEYGVLVTRGVLLDMARLDNSEWCEPGSMWKLDDIRRALDTVGVELRTGDALLLRNGHDKRRKEIGPWDADTAAAGLHASAVPWLVKKGVSVFGADGETDVRPSPIRGVTLPIHVLCLTMAGIPLLDNLDLDGLGTECAVRHQNTFALVVSPLKIEGATGGPVRPVAIF